MKLKLTALLGLALCAPLFAQDHAPLLATCEADVALWYHQDEFTDYVNAQTAFTLYRTPNRTPLNLLPLREVIARHEEMTKCWSMTQRDIFYKAHVAYIGIFQDREHDFLVRHNLMGQFTTEDDEGKR